MITRRGLLEGSAKIALAAGSARLAAMPAEAREQPDFLSPLLPSGTREEAVLDALPGKKPLIKLTYRPPNYETPIFYFRSAITPNDAFFVRYHLAGIEAVDAKTWTLNIGGDGARGSAQLGLADLKKLPAFEVTAVCQCAGNRRGLLHPHVAGVQWSYGAMGCARWKGARLKDVLELAGLRNEAVEIVFEGADGPVLAQTPDFAKSIPVSKALDETTLIAYEMNGEPLPHWNGFPARIVVPGWTATYWVKHVSQITAVTKPFDGYWMKKAYRIPAGKFPVAEQFLSQESSANAPITEIVVNSLITSPFDGTRVHRHRRTAIDGIAWDGGSGIRSVEISIDGGKSWEEAKLGEDLGRFAFRPFSFDFVPRKHGRLAVAARATNRAGQTQIREAIENPAGYNNNVIQTITLDAV